jgi:hypothetical protein
METEQAADVFGLLSDEIRLDVLETIARAQHDRGGTGVAALSFSEIYERVDVDDTSKLSYHLGELTGTFLRKREGSYAFTHAGERLVRFVLSGNYRSPPEFGPVETEGRCLHCGGTTLEATYHEQFFFVRCSDCERPAFSYRVRPAQVRAHEGTALLDSVIWEQAGDFVKMRQGVCPECAGRIETEVIDAADERVPDDSPVSFAVRSECRQCLRGLGLPLTHAVAYHPESVAFHWEHGVDIMGTGFWEFHQYLYDGRWVAERTDADPAEYRVELERDAASLRLYLDGSAAVDRTERVRRTDRSDRRS